MSEPFEFWLFIVANAGVFLAGGLLTVVSYMAYRQSGRLESYRYATLGFGFVVASGLVEPLYQVGVRGDPYLEGTKLLLLQSVEGLLMATGLGLLFYAILRQDSADSGRASNSVEDVDSEFNRVSDRRYYEPSTTDP